MRKLFPVILFASASCFTAFTLVKKPVNNVFAEEDKVIKPFAEYLFQDADNLGKDTSGNGFNLNVLKNSAKNEAINQKEEEGQKYLAIRHDTEEDGITNKNSGGAQLYAPELGNTNKDFSDLIDGNYTFSVTLRANYYSTFSGAYVLCFGRYCSAPQICCWNGALELALAHTDYYQSSFGELQEWLEDGRYYLPIAEERNNTWVTFTWSADVTTGKMRFYLDGQFYEEVSAPNGTKTRLTNIDSSQEASSYTFTIGGQGDVRGGSIDPVMGAICDYKQVRIFDCKLSDANVAALYAGENAVLSKQEAGNNVYVTNIKNIDSSNFDLDITDMNTVNGVVKDQLAGKKIKATLSNGTTKEYDAIWYPNIDNYTFVGKALINDGINCENTMVTFDYQYVCKLSYDPTKVDVSQIYLDNKAYEFGTEISSTRHTVKFVLTPKKGVTIDTVEYNGMEWEAEENDELEVGSFQFIIQFSKGAEIIITTTGDVKTDEGGGEAKGSGCGGSLIASAALISTLALAGAILLKKKED